MYRFIHLSSKWSLATHDILLCIMGVLTLLFCWHMKRSFSLSRSKSIFLLISLSVGSYLGAMIFHLTFSKSSEFGLSQYGSILFQIFLGWIILKDEKNAAKEYFVAFLIMANLIARLGCLLTGCCWGEFTTDFPWPIVFNHPDAVTPLQGITLFPTQVFYIIHMVLLLALYLINKSRKWVIGGNVWIWFIALFSIGRLLIDPYRGDWNFIDTTNELHYNGLISISLLTLILLCYIRKVGLAFIAFLLFSSCHLENQMPKDVFLSTKFYSNGIELYDIDNRLKINDDFFGEKKGLPNLLLIIVDEITGKSMNDSFPSLYGKEKRFEDRYWWRISKKMRELYDHVVRIHWSKFDATSLKSSAELLESYSKEYDIFILGHGFPNHLVSSKDKKMVSWKDLQALEGYFANARLLYSSACFGDTLINEFLGLGAKRVITYKGFQNNLVFQEYLLEDLKGVTGIQVLDERLANLRANFKKRLALSLLRRWFATTKLGVKDFDRYVESLAMPIYSQ